MKKKVISIVTHPLFTGSAVMIAGSNGINVINYLYNLAMGRLLGPINYGELASLLSLLGLLSMVPSSLGLVVIKYVSSNKSEAESQSLVSWLNHKVLIISVVLFLLVIIFTPVIISFMHFNSPINIILIGLLLFVSIQSLFFKSVLQGIMAFKKLVFTIFVENLFKLITSIFLVYLGLSVFGALGGITLSVGLGWILSRKFITGYLAHKPSTKPNLHSLRNYAVSVFVQSISTTSLMSADLILVKHFFSAYDAGIYAAMSILGRVIFYGASPISSVMFPLVSKRQSKGDNYKSIFKYSLFMTASIAICILLIYYFFPVFSIKLLYGSLYTQYANLLVFFGLFMSLISLASLLLNYHLSVGNIKVVMIPLLAAIIQVGGILIYHPNLKSIILISSVAAIVMLILLMILSLHLNKYLKINK